MALDLDRFVLAQQPPAYDRVLAELRRGQKTSHWIWFIFPQVAGLGLSELSRYYAIPSLDDARAYLAHPVLGPRLRECAGIVAATDGRTAEQVFGAVDAMKVRSCMTLFHRAAPAEAVFREVLDRFYGGSGRSGHGPDARLTHEPPAADPSPRTQATRPGGEPPPTAPSGTLCHVPSGTAPLPADDPDLALAHPRRAGAPLGRGRAPDRDLGGDDDRRGPQGTGAGDPRRDS